MQPLLLNVPLLQLGFFHYIIKNVARALTNVRLAFAAGFSISNSPVCAFYLAACTPLLCCSHISATPCVCPYTCFIARTRLCFSSAKRGHFGEVRTLPGSHTFKGIFEGSELELELD